MGQDKLNQIIEAAKLYYQLDYNQQEIAKKLGVSRPTVSRFLQQAKEQGIVKIEIVDPSRSIETTARELEQKYHLKKALIASVSEYEDQAVKPSIGKCAAEYLYETVKDNDVIGVTWGTTLFHIAKELKYKPVKDVKVIQLKGGVSHSEIETYASEVVNLFGKAFGATPYYLPLPAIVDHPAVKQTIEADRHIHKLLEMGKNANIAVFTVGGIVNDSLLFRLGYLSDEDLQMINSCAAGDICSRFFDGQGNICSESLNNRTIGIELDQLKNKELSILAAGGMGKVNAIHAALKGQYANVLITDEFTAKLLLDKEKT
ncbi:deoxyribonucleoside regulator [Scopulibacillus daqui]|uniref:Deoxyribonucleoside regulator n=1 Tax=Scopulibacillus daqui TaxID=1469162 RepID=A0ABS2Q011_9BACL|nr:sugar-binding transcriptional regulator [Scopulibacillus daqui]MBM7645646.1 deoxyribonucleoside regulator [Scopulibacillus daqui]